MERDILTNFPPSQRLLKAFVILLIRVQAVEECLLSHWVPQTCQILMVRRIKGYHLRNS